MLRLFSSRVPSSKRNRADASLFPRTSLLISPLHICTQYGLCGP